MSAFYLYECVCWLMEKAFTAKYQKWFRKHDYNFSQNKTLDIYPSACDHFSVTLNTVTAKLLVEQATSPLQTTSAILATLRNEIHALTTSLPEHPIVMEIFGVGSTSSCLNSQSKMIQIPLLQTLLYRIILYLSSISKKIFSKTFKII